MNRRAMCCAFALASSALYPVTLLGADADYLNSIETSKSKAIPASVLSVIGRENYDAMIGPFDPGHISAAGDNGSISRMIDGINASSQALAQRKQGLDAFNGAHEWTMTALQVGGAVHPVAGAAVTVVGKILTDKVNIVIKAETEKAERQYRENVTLAVRAAVANAGEQSRQKWLDKGVTDQDAGNAMVDLIGEDQADFFNKFGMAGLPSEAKADITNAKADIVMEALSRYKQFDGQQRKEDLVAIQGQMTQQSTQIAAMATDLITFKDQISSQMDGIQTVFDSRVRGLSAEVDTVHREVTAVGQDVTAIQMQMWKGMSPREQLSALNDGFMRKMEPADKEALKVSLTKTVQILDTRDTAVSALQTAGKVAGFLAAVGVPIDVENFQKNVNTGVSAVNVISNIAMGNWIGAFGAASGLFGGGGGGGPDPAIMAKLDQIEKLQKQTIEKIDALSNQLKESTAAILSRLDRIELKLDKIITVQTDTTYASQLKTCGNFIERAKTYGMKDGFYPSYMARAAHFDADNKSYHWYEKCRANVDQWKSIDPQANSVGSQGIVPPIFVESIITKPSDYHIDPFYQRMLSLTMRSAGKDVSPDCWDRSLALLSDAPSRFSIARISDFDCTSSGGSSRKLTAEQGTTINGRLALMTFLSSPAIRTIVGYAMFLAPYDSLQETRRGKTVLRSLKSLARDGGHNKPDDDAIIWPKHYSDLLNIAVAQHTVLSGIYAVPFTETRMNDTGYGSKPGAAWLDQAKVGDDHKCSDDAISTLAPNGQFDAESYSALTCVLAENPWFLSNFVRHLINTSLVKTKSTLGSYSFALASNDGTYITALLPGLPLVWIKPTVERKSPWMLEIKDAAGEPWQIPLPTVSEIRSETVSYRVGADEIIKLRNDLQTRVIMQSPEVEIMTTGETDSALLRRAFMVDPTLAAAEIIN